MFLSMNAVCMWGNNDYGNQIVLISNLYVYLYELTVRTRGSLLWCGIVNRQFAVAPQKKEF